VSNCYFSWLWNTNYELPLWLMTSQGNSAAGSIWGIRSRKRLHTLGPTWRKSLPVLWISEVKAVRQDMSQNISPNTEWVTVVLITERGLCTPHQMILTLYGGWFREKCCGWLKSWTLVHTAPTLVIISYFYMFEKKTNLILTSFVFIEKIA
jgi:hypothetical protein